MRTVYTSRYKAVKNRQDFEVVTIKVYGGYINLTQYDYEMLKRDKKK